MTQRIPIPSFPYSNLHYSYINPASSYRNRNVEKRQRQKDNYADLYLEKKNYVLCLIMKNKKVLFIISEIKLIK